MAYRYNVLLTFAAKYGLGIVEYAPRRVRMSDGRCHEPNVMILGQEYYHLRSNHIWYSADWLWKSFATIRRTRKRDYEDKLAAYAETKIREYWIVDPETRIVTVHRLDGDRDEIHGEFCRSQQATSVLQYGFAVDVSALFAVVDDVAE